MSTMRVATVSNVAGTGSPDITGGELCRAWANIDQSGAQSVRDSFNIASITDNTTGSTTITFNTAFPNANYAFTTAAGNNGSSVVGKIGVIGDNSLAPSVSASGIIAVREIDSTTTQDAARLFVSFFGDRP